MRPSRSSQVAGLLCLSMTACTGGEEPDAYGNVEAIDVVVSAEASGRIESFTAVEGEQLAAGAIAGTIETTTHALERRRLEARREATSARTTEISRQIAALEIRQEIAARAYERTKRLYEKAAATARELDQAEREHRVLDEEIAAAHAQEEAVRKEVEAIEAEIARVTDRMNKGRVVNPVGGTVLTTYARTGEVAQLGQPLYRIASLDTMEVRAYVGEPQLASLGVGQRADVSVDTGGDRRVMPATVTWISSQAEFTPTPIQTRDERTELVYAIKLRLANSDGVLKIGMPADVSW